LLKKALLAALAVFGFFDATTTRPLAANNAFSGTFDFSMAPDAASSMKFHSGAQTLTVTSTAGHPVVREQHWSSGRRGPIALYSFFAPMRFDFSIPVTSVVFGFGDGGGDDDSPVVIRAFDSDDKLIDTLISDFPLNAFGENTVSGSFPQGAAYFTATSGPPTGYTDTLFWRVVSFTAASTTLPEIRVGDSLPALAAPSGGIDCNPSTIGSLPLDDRRGALADGVSSLILRMTTSRPISFALANGTVDGTLTACGGGSATNLSPINGVVAVVYTPPDTFGSSSTAEECVGLVPSDPTSATERRTLGCRLVRVTAVSADKGVRSESTASLWLNRVPVVLVHGFSSSHAMWDKGGWLDTLKGRGFVASTVDYELASSNSFASDPTATFVLESEIRRVLWKLKREQIAGAQVDVVAHSMGGLVARQLSVNSSQNKVSLNANSGWIHRLVTIGTPHLGSPWASMVYPLALSAQLKGTIAAWLSTTGVPSGALADMMPGSAALHRLQSSTLKTRAILGIAPPAASIASYMFFKMISGGLFTTPFALFGEANDIIVGESSQAGGRSSPATADKVMDVIHSSALLPNRVAEAEADSAKVRDFAIEALDKTAAAFQNMVPIEASGSTSHVEWPGTHPPLTALVSTDVQLRITSPAPGTAVTPGSTLAIQVEATGPLVLSDLLVVVEGAVTADAMPTVPSTITVQLPLDLPVGTLTVGVLGMDTTGKLVGDSTTIAVSLVAVPTAIAVTPVSLNFDAEVAAQQLSAFAVFGSGALATREDITRGATFTTTDATVATVSARGLVTAVRAGTTSILVSQGGLVVSVPVTVSGTPALATITGQPSGALVALGERASFSASAFGTPTPTVQWQVSTDAGTTFSNIPAATTNSYAFTAQAADNGKLYRAVFTNMLGAAISNAGTLTVESAPSVTQEPQSQTVVLGAIASFTAAASGVPTPTIQWQYRSATGAWIDVPGATQSPYQFTPSISDVGREHRAVFTNSRGVAMSSNSAQTFVLAAPAVTAHPTSQAVAPDGTVQFTAVATGGPVPNATWQESTDAGQTWTNSAAKGTFQITNPYTRTTTLTVNAVVVASGKRYRATFANNSGAATTNAAILTVAQSTASAPIGSFDTPAAGAAVAGSIAVTGWALDDLGVDRVEIWRDLVAGETTPPYPGPGPGTGKVFIANAFFVAGARPDVAAVYTALPQADRAGWGYLLLTQGLWNQGNGTYTLYAVAFDQQGRSTTLGSKTITASNATATKPFGGLDVPAYGETKSGSFYNFGWALTPNPNAVDSRACVITNGNVFVGIDSGALVPVSYGDARSDIALNFPGFSNTNNPSGAYLIDTTAMTNGTHQIGWFVVDSCGRAEGIGSRFFTVLNGGTSAAPAELTRAAIVPVAADEVVNWEPLTVRRNGVTTLVYPNPSGDRVVPIAQSERVEVQLPVSGAATYAGYQVVNGEAEGLPLGSTLDAEHGIFYWQPAPGFLGAHDLEFAPSDGSGVLRVRAVVGTAVHAAIDMPREGIVGSSFVVEGWAIDQAASSGAGIDSVDVWAFPTGGGKPQFLGVAAHGDRRPDIGALFGEQFAGASYSLTVGHLASGTYDVVVYPHSAVAGDFHGAKVVRVTVP
jgi:pimeloyl-ACP methyl ester carboxylesterase